MSRKNCKENINVSIVNDAPQLTLQDVPQDIKVNIWGYELCNGAEWKDFLEVVNKLGKENDKLKRQIQQDKDTISHLRKALGFKNEKVGYDVNEMWANLFIDSEKQNSKLKQQLEEAKKIIASDISPALRNAINTIGNAIANSLDEPTIIDLVKRIEQDKNQLAIQELEKVKNLAVVLLDDFCHSFEYHQKYMRGHRHIEFYDLIRGIDNQIKELKGE